MPYDQIAIPQQDVPRSVDPLFQYLLDTYASETNKTISTWRGFAREDLGFRPHPRSSSVEEILKHQLLSERRFFGEFVGTPEPRQRRSCPKPWNSPHTSSAWRSWLVRGSPSLPRSVRRGGWKRSHSSRCNASASGFSGGACCTPAIIERSSRFTCVCWTDPFRRSTVLRPIRVGKAPIRRRRSRRQREKIVGRLSVLRNHITTRQRKLFTTTRHWVRTSVLNVLRRPIGRV